MADFSVSLHEDDSFNLDHDNRKYLSKNIDPDRVSENISYAGNVSLQSFYETTFQKAYEEFIERTRKKHPERVRDLPSTYYEFVTQKQAEESKEYERAKASGAHVKELANKGAYTKVAKQIIIQVGNVDDFDGLTPEEQQELRENMRDVLKEYMDTFQAENPNFRIVNAVIHMDEISLSPHLHLTYVGVVEQKRGQTVANSQSGALKKMGFETDPQRGEDGEFVTGQMKWQTKERERVISIAKKFGLDVGYTKGNKGKGQTIGEYRAAKQMEREAQMERSAIDARKAELAEVTEMTQQQTALFNIKSQELYDITVAVDQKYEQHDAVEEQIKAKTEELALMTEQVDNLPNVLNQSANCCEQELQTKLIPPTPLTDNYERVTKGAFSNKKTYVMVPEKEYEVLERRNGLKPDAVRGIIKEALQPLRDAIMELPVVKNLTAVIQHLEHEVSEWKKRYRKSEREKETLQKENQDLKIEKAVADRVLQTKLHLSPEVIDKMKADAAREILMEQTRDDDVLGW